MNPGTRNLFEITSTEFVALVPDASRITNTGQYSISVDGIIGDFRLKRGKGILNQNHMINGEPLVVHIPETSNADEILGTWYVIPVNWLIRYAITHPNARQHTLHSLECFMFANSEIPEEFLSSPGDLTLNIKNAIRDARNPSIQQAIRYIQRANTFALTHFEEAADTISIILGIIPITNIENTSANGNEEF